LEQFGTYISIDQLGYPRASIRDCVQIAETINRRAGLIILGMYNLALALASIRKGDGDDRLKAQEALLRNSVSESRLRDLKAKLGNANLVTVPLFHRAQLLTMIKLVAKFGRTEGGNKLEIRDDFDVIAELGLLVNSLWRQPKGGSDGEELIAQQLALSLEIENPARIPESMVRPFEMLGNYLPAMARHDRIARRIERALVFTSGLNSEELFDLTFAIWSYYRSLSVEEVVADQRKAHFNPQASSEVASGPYLTRILDAEAVSFESLAGLDFGPADSGRFLNDHTELRRKPVWKFGSDNYLCFDPAFLQDKLCAGVFWTVMNAFDEQERVGFTRVWGRLFEEYVRDLLLSMIPEDRVWISPFFDDGTEAFDFVIDSGPTLVVAQLKSTFVPVIPKYADNPKDFFAGMESRFGDTESGALKQIRESILRCFDLGVRVPPVTQFRERRFREVIPIIVHQEPVLQFGLVSRHFVRRFRRQIDSVVLRPDLHVRPVIYLHVNDLHMISQYVRDGLSTVVDLLHAKLDIDRHDFHSFEEVFDTRIRKPMSATIRADSRLCEMWEAQSEASMERFRAGAYH